MAGAVVGLGVVAVGRVLAVAGLVVQLKGSRRLHVWRNPLTSLTRAQRRELRGRSPLARYAAELTVHQRSGLPGQAGLLLLFAGGWIGSPSVWRAVFAAVLAVVLALSVAVARRDVVRARAFLDAHPAPEVSAA